MDIKTPIENPELVKSIHDYVNSQSEKDEKKLQQALLNAKFLAPAILENWERTSQNRTILDKDMKMKLISIQDGNNEIYLPAFTDWNEVGKWRKDDDLKTIIFSFYDYVKVLKNNKKMIGIVINPFSENIIITKQQINSIVNSNMLLTGESVKIGVPKKDPIAMKEALKEYFESEGTVTEAYLLLTLRDNGEQSYLLILETDEDVNVLYPKLAQIVKKNLQENEIVDFISSKEKFGKAAIEKHVAFFKKER